MKKSNLAVVEEGRVHRTGPVKEREQITVRIDAEVRAAARAIEEEDGVRITDLMESGLIREIEARRHQLPAWQKAVRNILANANAKETRLFRGLGVRIKEKEVVKRSIESDQIWELLEWYLEQGNIQPHAKACLDLYRASRDN